MGMKEHKEHCYRSHAAFWEKVFGILTYFGEDFATGFLVGNQSLLEARGRLFPCKSCRTLVSACTTHYLIFELLLFNFQTTFKTKMDKDSIGATSWILEDPVSQSQSSPRYESQAVILCSLISVAKMKNWLYLWAPCTQTSSWVGLITSGMFIDATYIQDRGVHFRE